MFTTSGPNVCQATVAQNIYFTAVHFSTKAFDWFMCMIYYQYRLVAQKNQDVKSILTIEKQVIFYAKWKTFVFCALGFDGRNN